uniref:WD40 repeat domain 95 n=1 Tax=Pundamilia nyererei TaxID=303518 RepID=A0A3B4FYP8_9CICH
FLLSTSSLLMMHRLLITGGMDKLIRLWNPHYSGKPTGILKGHSAPIISIRISSEDNQIFSVSTDCTVKVTDDSFLCFTSDPKASRIHGDISACAYSPAMKSLYIAADCMTMLPLKLRQRLHRHFTVSHNEPVLCCGYSKEFRQVVSCTEGSVVRVWDFDTGCQLFEFGGSHELSSITCLTFDPKGRRLVTGGRDGSLKIWNFNNGLCLKTLKKDGECREVCDFQNASLFDLHHVQRPQASWQDDLKNGHKDDILCMAQCPPFFVATGSSDGEIIVWNVDSGRIQCRFVSPIVAEQQDVKGLDTSVPSIVFLKDSYLKELSSTTALLSSGAEGQCYKQCVPPEMPSPISSHVSLFCSSLHIVDNDQVVLTSSTDYTVRLWSTQGEFIGTFGQAESWRIHISSSWIHPGVPFEVLTDPLSMPDHEILNVKTGLSHAINPDMTEEDRGELKVNCIISQKLT